MRKYRLSFIAGFMPALCMAFMLGFEYLLDSKVLLQEEHIVAAAEIIPFLLPLLVIVFFRRLLGEEGRTSRFRGFSIRAMPFIINVSIATSLLSFVLNSFVSSALGDLPGQGGSVWDGYGILSIIVLVVLLPAVFEELFFRGGIISSYESYGAMAAIFVSALTIALIHGSIRNFVGPFVAGLVYGYITCALGSVWPAVLAHMINNALHLATDYFARSYSMLGILDYFILIAIILLGLFVYLAMKNLEKLLGKGRIKRLKPGGAKAFATSLIFSPGLWLLALMYVFKLAYL